MKKKVSIELDFLGNGKIIKKNDFTFYGGVPEPDTSSLSFSIHPEEIDENGIMNPIDNKTYEGGLQICITSDSYGYEQLGKYFLSIARIDTTADPDYHEHLGECKSVDAKCQFDFIFRKQDKKEEK